MILMWTELFSNLWLHYSWWRIVGVGTQEAAGEVRLSRNPALSPGESGKTSIQLLAPSTVFCYGPGDLVHQGLYLNPSTWHFGDLATF